MTSSSPMTNSGWDVVGPQPGRTILEKPAAAQAAFDRAMEKFREARPHKWPGNPPDGDPDVLAWRCAACEQWVREYGPNTHDWCPVDWRASEPGSGGRSWRVPGVRTQEEERVVDPDTGGAKGSKPARFDMIPPSVLHELAEHYGKGETKYPGDPETGQANWQRGYAWHLSAAALQRHLYAWLSGEDVDEESGSNHLIAVIWHAVALRYFQQHGLGRDDIWTRRAA